MAQPYHHGNLREALLQAALQLVGEVGPAGFTLREVARRAGVSHNAPYRHFPNKDELLAAVAAQGFHELGEAMAGAAQAGSTALERLQRSGCAYVAFALRRPEHFTVMFDAPVVKSKNPASVEAGEKAYAMLVSFVEDCQKSGELPPGEPMARALVAWSLVHGIAKLAIAQRLPFRSSVAALKFAELAIHRSMPSLAWRGS